MPLHLKSIIMQNHKCTNYASCGKPTHSPFHIVKLIFIPSASYSATTRRLELPLNYFCLPCHSIVFLINLSRIDSTIQSQSNLLRQRLNDFKAFFFRDVDLGSDRIMKALSTNCRYVNAYNKSY